VNIEALAEARLTMLLEAEMENTALRARVAELTEAMRSQGDDGYRQGHADGCEDERDAVVAWLREEGELMLAALTRSGLDRATCLAAAANCVERGDHRHKEKKP
jgi:hypothetical protein